MSMAKTGLGSLSVNFQCVHVLPFALLQPLLLRDVTAGQSCDFVIWRITGFLVVSPGSAEARLEIPHIPLFSLGKFQASRQVL